jgi:hypothetical protein
MSNKRKLDDLIDSFTTLSFCQKPCTTLALPPPAKRGHYLPISVSKINLKPCTDLYKTINYKQKNIFGLDQIPHKEMFTREEVQILLDQRERILYKRYLQMVANNDKKEKIIKQLKPVI